MLGSSITVGTVLYGAGKESTIIKFRDMSLALTICQEAFDGYRVTQISDT
jgi:hypothetical protein